MAGVKTPQPRYQPEGGERSRGGNRQARAAALRAQGIDALRHFQQGAVQAAKQPFAALGEAHLPWQSFEQRHAKPVFQGADLMGNRCRRHREFFGGGFEAQQARGGFEGTQGGQRQRGKHFRTPWVKWIHPD